MSNGRTRPSRPDRLRVSIRATERQRSSAAFINTVLGLPDVYSFLSVVTLARHPRLMLHDSAIPLPPQLRLAADPLRDYAETFGRRGRWSYLRDPYLWPYEPAEALRAAAELSLASLATGQIAAERLSQSDLTYLARVYRELRLPIKHENEEPAARPLPFRSAVDVGAVIHHSPVEVILIVVGPLGATFLIMFLAHWFAVRSDHEAIDLANKKHAEEAAAIVVDKLRSGELPIAPEVVKAVIENARILPVPLPRIADIKSTLRERTA